VEQSSEAPDDLENVRGFVNTLDVEYGTDRLETVGGAVAWLAEMGWSEGIGLDDGDLEPLRRLREAFRFQLLDHAGHSGLDDSAAVISEMGRIAPLVVDAGVGGPKLSPGGSGVAVILARLLAAYYAASVHGRWARLKVCGNDTCGWAYYDHSRNGSRRWCSSKGCGNLMAARAYRDRNRQDS